MEANPVTTPTIPVPPMPRSAVLIALTAAVNGVPVPPIPRSARILGGVAVPLADSTGGPPSGPMRHIPVLATTWRPADVGRNSAVWPQADSRASTNIDNTEKPDTDHAHARTAICRKPKG